MENWVELQLKNLFLIERGGSPRPIKSFITNENDGINWIKIGDTEINNKYINQTNQKIKKVGLQKSREVFPGDFLLTNSMSFGRPYISKIYGAIHDGWLVLRHRVNNVTDSSFYYHYLTSPIVFNQFSKLATGSTVKNLNKQLAGSIKICLPPLPEQRAIVKKIESLFSELDHGIASLKQAQDQLKIYRQAVLKKAFEGKYTEEKNYGNSDDLDSYVFEIKNAKESYFQSQLKCWLEEKLFWEQSNSNKSKPRKPSRSPIIEISKDVVDNLPKLKSNWEWTTLSHVTLQIGDIDHKMPKTIDDGIPYLSTGDIGKGHGLRFETAKQISVEDYKRLSLKIKPNRNDIIFPRYGTIGRNIIVETDRDFLVSYSCAILKNIPELVNHKFIYYYTLSPLAIKEIERNVVQTTQANIGIKSIQGFHLPFCLKEEQNQIVQEIESRLSVCDHIEASIKENLAKSEALRQSILKKAFAGKLLTREELAACKKEKDWCTGAALLDRIKNEEKK